MDSSTLHPHFVENSSLLLAAYDFALEAHSGMTRKGGGEPYINHPVRVAAALWNCGLDEEAIAAGFLHDVVEDTPHTLEEVEARTNAGVRVLVDALSENKETADYEQRKHDHLAKVQRAGPRAAAVFCADKLVNLQDMLRAYEVEGERLAERFNGSLNQKENHTRNHLEMLGVTPGIQQLSIYKELLLLHQHFVELRVARRRTRQENAKKDRSKL